MKSNLSMNTTNLSNITANLENKVIQVEELLKRIDTEMKKFDGSGFWKGQTQEIVYSGYQDVSKAFPIIVQQLKDFNTFLRKTIDEYTKTENAIDDAIDANSENLDVN